jgi:heat-inducible transcriptional repressor
VLQGGDVRQQMLTLAEVFDQEHLSQTAEHITAVYGGRDAEGVSGQAPSFSELGRELIRLIADVMSRADAVSSGEIYHDGLANVLTHPEFAQSDSARQALRLLEERSFLEEVMAKALSPGIGSVQVVIGGEGAWEELRDCSMVLARYGAAGFATGALGVLGPTRMAYGRTISAVRYVAGLMSDLMVEAYAG